MSLRKGRQLVVAGIIERCDNHILIARVSDTTQDSDGSACWQFPRDVASPEESPEKAMRRFAKEELDLTIEVVTGQPPIAEDIEGQRVELRYFFCGLISGEVSETSENHLRWIPKAHLREYDFDAASKPVVEWLLDA